MEKNISIYRGDTFAFGMEFEGLNQDLDSAFFTLKKSYDGETVLQKSIGDGISKVENGKYRVRVAPEDTENLDAGQYYYDCEISANGDVFTLLSGTFELKYDVTKRE